VLAFHDPVYCFFPAGRNHCGLLQKLDSVQGSPLVSRHFAELYFNTTAKAVVYFSRANKPVRELMRRFEQRFACFFLTAANAYGQKEEIPPAWKTYFTDSSLSRLQYFLLGANAHINGDMWQAMTTEFSLQELKTFKNPYYRYNRKLKEALFFVYNTAFDTAPGIRLLHGLSVGFDRIFTRLMLVRWRKRQMKLSLLWFTDKEKFAVKFEGLQKKMAVLDKLVLQNL
jgi:hypothetical protein